MDAFNKLTNMLLQALETREPNMDLLSSFVDHWKSITTYYMTTTDDNRPVKQTDIPWCLRQMLDILVYEEKQQNVEDTGVCLEYLLQHKILETLCTLGKAQYPPGMFQQILLFFSKLLNQMQKPLLHLVNVYRPVQKLIRLCALPGSQTEKEEAQFLLVVCSKIKQDSNMLGYVLEIPDATAAKTPAADQSQLCAQKSNHRTESPQSSSQSQASASSTAQSENTLLMALLQLTKCQKGPVCLKAYEGFLLLSSLQSPSSGDILANHTCLSELLVGRLLELYALLPLQSMEPGQVQNWPHTSWSSQFSRCSSDLTSDSVVDSDHVTNFFCWFDFLDHMMKESPQVLSVKVARCIHSMWLVDVVQSQLLHTSEQMIFFSTSVLCAVVRLVQSSALLDLLVHFLLRTQTVRNLLLQHCDHISDQISMASLSLVEELLQKPHRDILDVVVLDFLQRRSYLSPHAAGVDDRRIETSEDSDDLEEDPFFSDSLFSDSLLPPPPPPPSLTPSSGPGSSTDVINSFLCLVPIQVRSAQLMKEGGYESYVHDAHTLVAQCQSLSQSWDWPVSLPPPAPPSSSDEEEEFFEGPLLRVLFDRLGRILEQPYELNLQLTAVLSRLSSFDHPLLHEYLLNPYIHLSPCSRSLFSVLIRVMGELMQRIQSIANLSDRLLNTRRQLLGLDYNTGLEHMTLLRAVIVLEEFCKELAAITFVKLPLDQN